MATTSRVLENPAVRLAQARRTLALSKIVSLVCVALCLLIFNTALLPRSLAFASVSALLLVGAFAFIVGFRAAVLIPKLERQASASSDDA